jgi:hypothetical protein
VNGQLVRLTWYRFRATFGRRRGGYLSLVLFVGLLGGLAMGSVAGARRTESSFPTFLASTNPSDLDVITGPLPVRQFARLPGVEHVESATFLLNAALLSPNGAPIKFRSSNRAYAIGSVDGLYFNQDRVSVVKGRMADPTRANEAVMTAQAAQILGVHVGETVPVGFYTTAQTNSPKFGTPAVRPERQIDIRLVGIVTPNSAVVEDDAQRSISAVIFMTPALTSQVNQCCSSDLVQFGFRLDHGAGGLSAVEREIGQTLLRAGGGGGGFYVSATSVTEAETQRSIQPESIALGVFGGIAGLATLLIAAQVIGRQLRLGADESATLRALGADPSMTASDGLFGIAAAVLVGSLLAAAVAVALSPLAPIGPVRPVYPDGGIAFDWTVLGFGVIGLVAVLIVVAGLLAVAQAPHRIARRRERLPRESKVGRALATSRLPVATATGVQFALASGRQRNAAPVRSAIIGTTAAIIVLVGTVTFGASLNSLVSHPALYGWNWNYELDTPEGGGYIDAHQATQLLGEDPDVAAWTGVYFDSLQVDGLTVPIIGATPNAPVGPPVLSGHTLEAKNQIVLGSTTLAQLHKRVGDTVEARYGTVAKLTRLRIVGTATMPAVGPGLGLRLSMGTGALVSDLLLPANDRNPSSGPPGPGAYFVRLRAGTNPAAALLSLRRIDAALDSDPNAAPMSVVSAQRPAEIVNYRSMGSIPAYLGAALAMGAVIALGLTLVASVRRRRRELALLKTLGFTRRQLAAVVAWQSSVAVFIGTLVGIPLGIVLGRVLWDAFADEIGAVPAPTISALSVVLIALGALVLANVLAAIPGRIAARTPTAVLLRAE